MFDVGKSRMEDFRPNQLVSYTDKENQLYIILSCHAENSNNYKRWKCQSRRSEQKHFRSIEFL